jgi:6-phosphogluconolactonase (cycloisomerase 2 family)
VLYAKIPDIPEILAYRIDANSGNLTAMQIVSPPASNNSFCTTSAGNSILLAATPSASLLYTDDENWDQGTSTSTTRIDGYSIATDGSLTLVSGSPFAVPSSVSHDCLTGYAISPASTTLYAVDSTVGVAEFQINASGGALTPAADVQPSSLGLSGGIIDPSGEFYYAAAEDAYPDSGIAGFAIDQATGGLTPLTNSPYFLPAEGQVSAAIMDPTGRFLYAAVPDSGTLSQVAGFVRDQTTGDLTAVPGSPFSSGSNTIPLVWDLAMHPSGQFLYAYNLSSGTISAFAIDSSDGALSQVAGSPFQSIDNARAMAIDPQGKFVYLAIGSGQIAIHQVNTSTGALSAASQITVPDGAAQALAIVQVK